MTPQTRSIGIVGAGLIGRSWANVFARAGWQVLVWDPSADQRAAAHAQIARSLDDLQAHGLVQESAAATARVRVTARLEDAVQAADYVQESGPEVLEVKRETFAALDAIAPAHCVLASSTSAIVASRFTEELAGRARCIVAHPVNPPHLAPVVELCGAPWTSEATRALARKVMQDVGQMPVDVRREIDGFVLNRLQAALLTEAFRLVQDGVVSPRDLDRTVADGLGLRWAFMGPFETIELNAPARDRRLLRALCPVVSTLCRGYGHGADLGRRELARGCRCMGAGPDRQRACAEKHVARRSAGRASRAQACPEASSGSMTKRSIEWSNPSPSAAR
jgi:3-hydroxyacyl-CoA dehydrogenase